VKTLPQLAAAELAVMKLLWEKGDLTARQILDALYPESSSPQHGTVQRLLERLERKGFVDRDRSGPVQHFSPSVTRERYLGAELETLASHMTGGSLAPVLSFLIEEQKLSRAEIRRLRKIVEGR
jgi:BlaI family transcriptional regulator, penicillinase repressor